MSTFGPGLRPHFLHQLRGIAAGWVAEPRPRDRAAAAASLLARDAKGLIDLDALPRERELVLDAIRRLIPAAPHPRHWDGTTPANGSRPAPGPRYSLVQVGNDTRTGRAAMNAIGGVVIRHTHDDESFTLYHYPRAKVTTTDLAPPVELFPISRVVSIQWTSDEQRDALRRAFAGLSGI